MALCGISRIDGLRGGTATAAPIGSGDSDAESVAVIQSLLAGQGQRGLPNLLSPTLGIFGERTTAAVQNFRKQHGLGSGTQVDALTLQRLVELPAVAPIASRGYLTLVLDFEYGDLAKVLSVVAQMEGAGKFDALNLNTDKAGLSFGLIQWAQKPGRLSEILSAFLSASSADFVRIMAAGDPNLASALIAHTRKPDGGINPSTGATTDSAFDLIAEPWVSRFRAAALFKRFQQAQVRTALNAFRESLTRIQQYATQLNSERSVGFMLDLANQFGDAGARSIYKEVSKPGMHTGDLLQAMADESVHRMPDPQKAGTQARREHFLTTAFLSDEIFGEPAPRRQPPTRALSASTSTGPPSDKIASS